MNYKHIARVFLNWFEQEAHNLSVPMADGTSPFIMSDDGSFVIGYTGADGFRSYQGFVRDLAQARLSAPQAGKVLQKAIELVGETNDK